MALKYAQGLHGLDREVISTLQPKLPNIRRDLPASGAFHLVTSLGQMGANRVLFVGTPSLLDLRYSEIRGFARRVLEVLADQAPDTKTLAITINGPGFGLDEVECFESSVAGLIDALSSGTFPPALADIAILEALESRAVRFNQQLDQLIQSRILAIDAQGNLQVQFKTAAAERVRSVGYASDAKPLLFVAMPFGKICVTITITEYLMQRRRRAF